MNFGRRELLRGAGGLWVSWCVPAVGACLADVDQATQALGQSGFLHGVASGDPLPDSVIIWTRFTPTGEEETPLVHWRLATDSALQDVVVEGSELTDIARDFTIKVDVTGLEPGTPYFYAFTCEGEQSEIGRTRTAAVEPAQLRFAVVSCASYAHGFFHAYEGVASHTDLDAVIHLGDYIYEYGSGQFGERRDYEPPHELLTLDDYRLRYAQYRRDPQLRSVHREHPMIAVWDDHEVANNAWLDGAENHNPERGEGEWAARRAAATQAYFEWLPIREQSDGRTFRAFSFGGLADLIMLDTRLWGRDMQIEDPADPELQRSDRSLLGTDQELWLRELLESSRARWCLIGQQVMVGPMPHYTNTDSWAGYPAARRRLLGAIGAQSDKDCVVLTGDVHSSWAINLTEDPYDPERFDPDSGRGCVAVELVTPGVTSPFLSRASAQEIEPLVLQEPHVAYAQLWRRGYLVVEVDHSRVRARYFHYDAVEDAANPGEIAGGVFDVMPGHHRLVAGDPEG